jgi:phthiocerol/phenolphthiocerol synthesis type-I polyketide synthase E
MNDYEHTDEKDLFGIAIIGMAGRFPGAENVGEFWRNLKDGVESIRPFTPEELAAAGVDEATMTDPHFVNAGAPMPGSDSFDASFFDINAREAQVMDPQHRVFLETAWEALEDAGYDPESYPGPIGVFAGVGPNTYLQRNLATRPEVLRLLGRYAVLLASEKEYAVTRVSFKLNLTGPSFSVNTACSTSGVTVHVACQSLLNGECDMALAGGGRIHVPLTGGYMYEEGGILSPDGHCRAFDAEARGTVGGSGFGIIVLKRLSEAIEDGDNIYAVIKGSAINNDGARKVGFTAPSIQGQAAVISEALAMADVNPDSIGYIEAHGTGTSLGDPIEIAGLTEAYRQWTDRTAYCPIGSVKTNIGHLDAGAGIAGVIKAALVLKHQEIPASLHFTKPNPELDIENSPFYVNAELSPWPAPADGTPRRAGVSSFGLGGTNAHIVLEEAPGTEPSGPSRAQQLLLLSAKSKTALAQATEKLVEHLRQEPDINLADVAYTLQTGRQAFDHRRMLVCQDVDDAISALEPIDPKRAITSSQETADRDVVFMFSGQGSQYVNMGLELYQSEPVFRDEVDRCSEILKPHLGHDLRQILYPDGTDLEEAAQLLQQTAFTQPALFVIEYALAKLWMEWGIRPSAMVGHSIGEYVAACLAGVFSLEDALSLVAARGRLMQELPSGSMLAIALPPKEVQTFLDGKLDLAVVNAPSLCVVSGEREVVQELESELTEKGVGCRALHTSHAFHSRMMEPILETFTMRVGHVPLESPTIPFVSNVTGTWIRPDEATNPAYWARHLRQTVLFSDCLGELMQEPNRVLLEVGPGRTLATLAKQHPTKTAEHVVLSSLRHPKEEKPDLAFVLGTLGQLWMAGAQIDWSGFYEGERRRRIPLPTYPFERKRYWISPSETAHTVAAAASGSPIELAETPPGDLADSDQATEDAYEGAPRDSVERSLASIWRGLLGVEEVRYFDDFFDLGGSSLMALRMFSEIERQFGRNLPLSILFEASTLEGIADILREEDWTATWSPLVEIQPGDSRPPFFFVHAAGGNILLYRDLARHLGPDQPVYGLQAQGLDGEQPFLTTIEEMAALYLKEVQAVLPEGPYLLGGYCMGGTVALEMAQQLRDQGREVALLALFETYNWVERPPKSRRGTIQDLVQKLEFHLRNFLLLDAQGKRQFVYEKAKVLRSRSGVWYGMVLSKLGRRVHQRSGQHVPLAQLWDINEEAPFHYNPGVYEGRITNFLPVKEYTTNVCPGMDWERVAGAGVDTHRMPVFPAGMMVEPFVKQTAAELRECIDKALESEATGNDRPSTSDSGR